MKISLAQPKRLIVDFINSKFFTFALIGVVGFVVDATVLYAVVHLLGLDLYSARVISYLFAATTTWALNRRYTFKDHHDPRLLRQWLRFLAVNSVGGVINYAVYAISISVVPVVALYPVLGVALGSIAGLVANFNFSNLFVFRSQPIFRPLMRRLVQLLPTSLPLLMVLALFFLGLSKNIDRLPEAEAMFEAAIWFTEILRPEMGMSWREAIIKYEQLGLAEGPVFPLILSLFIFIFGAQVLSAQLLVLIMVLIAGLGYYRLLSQMYDRYTALAATSLLVSMPVLVFMSWHTLSDVLALAMTIVASYCLWHFLAGEGNRFLFVAALVIIIAICTLKFTVFAIPWLMLTLLCSPQRKEIFSNPVTYLMLVLFTVLLLLIAKFGIEADIFLYRWERMNVSPFLTLLHFIHPLIGLLSLLGLLCAVRYNDRKMLIIVMFFLFFVLQLSVQESDVYRYSLFATIVLCSCAALPLHYFRVKAFKWAYSLLIIIAMLLNVIEIIQLSPNKLLLS